MMMMSSTRFDDDDDYYDDASSLREDNIGGANCLRPQQVDDDHLPIRKKERIERSSSRNDIENFSIHSTSSSYKSKRSSNSKPSKSEMNIRGSDKSYEVPIPLDCHPSNVSVASFGTDVSGGFTANSYSSSTAITKIAVFGAYGSTGKHFVRLAVDAGYHVRALIPPDRRSDSLDQANVTLVHGAIDDEKSLKRTLHGTDFVVALLADTLTAKQYSKQANFLENFVGKLYSVMQTEPQIKVFLYQATALATDVRTGSVPFMARVIKSMAQIQSSTFLKDQEAALRVIAEKHGFRGHKREEEPLFRFIVTRPPSIQRDGPSVRKLLASRSQPGPMPIATVDLAEFTLNALVDNKLYDKCPYVVADSF